MPRWRVVFGVEAEAADADAAYERAHAFTAFLLQRKAEGHKALDGITPVIGPRRHTEVYGVGRSP